MPHHPPPSGGRLALPVQRAEVVVPGDPSVRITVHRPEGPTGLRPCVFSLHDGGYAGGRASWDDDLLADWCARLGVVGVSVDHRLAPRWPYPAPLTDCYSALTWVAAHAAELGIDAEQIGLHGTGAGGGLAAALALVARDHREVPLAFQLLDRPVLDDRQPHSRSEWQAYLGDLFGDPDLPGYAAAARSTDLRGLPPAYVAAVSRDPRRDEALVYATQLDLAGVPAELHLGPSAEAIEQDKTEWLRRRIALITDQEKA